MQSKKLYFKVYQDKDNTDGTFYIDTVENVFKLCQDDWYINDVEQPPVFEPIYLTEEEFKRLPEFTGF
jgi:hypothetical protein